MSHHPFTGDHKYGAITLNELLTNGGYLVTYRPRYCAGTPIKVGVIISGDPQYAAAMADAMTDSGDYCQHIENMMDGTDYFPNGEGATFEEAIANAMLKVNRHTREQFNHAWPHVLRACHDYAAIREAYVPWPSLEPTPWVEGLKADARNEEAAKEKAAYEAKYGKPINSAQVPSFTWTERSGAPMRNFLEGWLTSLHGNVPKPTEDPRYAAPWLTDFKQALVDYGAAENLLDPYLEPFESHLRLCDGFVLLDSGLSDIESQKRQALDEAKIAVLSMNKALKIWVPSIPDYFTHALHLEMTVITPAGMKRTHASKF